MDQRLGVAKNAPHEHTSSKAAFNRMARLRNPRLRFQAGGRRSVAHRSGGIPHRRAPAQRARAQLFTGQCAGRTPSLCDCGEPRRIRQRRLALHARPAAGRAGAAHLCAARQFSAERSGFAFGVHRRRHRNHPLWSMVQRLSQIGAPWTLHYSARTPEGAAFAEPIALLASRAGAGCT